MREFQAITKALADPNRVRLLLALERRELCVCQLIALLALAPSTVSKHLSILQQAGLLETRKQGKWIFYRQAAGQAPELVRDTLAWVRRSAGNTEQAISDAQRLAELLQMDVEQLCKLQGKS